MKINRQLALEGALLKAFNPLPNETAQRLVSPLSDKVLGLLPMKLLNGYKTEISRPDGTPMRVCVLRGKKTEGKTVGILWLHGGGYVLGAPEMAVMSFPRHLINNTNCVIVSPAYRLSAEAPYPAALEDAYTALQWLGENREALGITCDKFVIGGESAGGGLTAALCLYARDKGESCIGLQLPLYPMLDDRVTETSAHNTAPVWNTRANKSAWHIYLGDSVMNSGVSPYAAPARAEDLSGLPPAVSFIGTVEPFYAETRAFFDRLNAAGIETALREYDGAYHAFDMMAPYAKISKEAVAFTLGEYRRLVGKYITEEAV